MPKERYENKIASTSHGDKPSMRDTPMYSRDFALIIHPQAAPKPSNVHQSSTLSAKPRKNIQRILENSILCPSSRLGTRVRSVVRSYISCFPEPGAPRDFSTLTFRRSPPKSSFAEPPTLLLLPTSLGLKEKHLLLDDGIVLEHAQRSVHTRAD